MILAFVIRIILTRLGTRLPFEFFARLYRVVELLLSHLGISIGRLMMKTFTTDDDMTRKVNTNMIMSSNHSPEAQDITLKFWLHKWRCRREEFYPVHPDVMSMPNKER